MKVVYFSSFFFSTWLYTLNIIIYLNEYSDLNLLRHERLANFAKLKSNAHQS